MPVRYFWNGEEIERPKRDTFIPELFAIDAIDMIQANPFWATDRAARIARGEANRQRWRAAHPWRARWRDATARWRELRIEIGVRLHYAWAALRGDWPELDD